MDRSIVSKNSKKGNNDIFDFILTEVGIIGVSIIIIASFLGRFKEEVVPELTPEPIQIQEEAKVIVEDVVIKVADEPETVEEDPQVILSDDDILAMVAMSEAGNQELLGKVAVVATILNRCDYYGLTVETVVTSPNQYSYPYYGTVTDECYRAVEIAKGCRDLFDSRMMFFRNSKYHDFGEPYVKIQDHYFSLIEQED